MSTVILLQDVGEWVPAAVGLGLVFLVAALGAVGLGWWVMRGDSRNRRGQVPGHGDQGLHEETH